MLKWLRETCNFNCVQMILKKYYIKLLIVRYLYKLYFKLNIIFVSGWNNERHTLLLKEKLNILLLFILTNPPISLNKH